MSRVFIITGTRKGLGRGLAEHYLAQGHRVYGCSRGAVDWRHDRYQHVELDVSDEAAVGSMVRAVKREAGQIDVLINNAGAASMNHLLLTPRRTVDRLLGTNVVGTFLFLREVGKVMSAQASGRIVNVTTVAVPLRLEGEAIYAASKASVESLTQVAARELGPFNITVNAIGPTPIETDLIKGVPRDKIEALVQRQALKRLGTPADVFNVVDFFISPRSDFVTGQLIYLGGVHG